MIREGSHVCVLQVFTDYDFYMFYMKLYMELQYLLKRYFYLFNLI